MLKYIIIVINLILLIKIKNLFNFSANKKEIILFLSFILILIIGGSWVFNFKVDLQTSSAISKPNIVVIMADDLDKKSLDRMVTWGLMPNLKKHVIDRGITFNNSFVTNSLCCPSRATFLTGQYSHNHNVLSNTAPGGSVTAFNDKNTLPVWLQKSGYYTSHIGKYLNGYGYSDINHDGLLNKDDLTYVPPGWDHWQASLDFSTYRTYNYKINDRGTIVYYGNMPADYQTDVFSARAYDTIKEARFTGKPLYLEVMPLAPHIEVGSKSSDVWKHSIRPAPRHFGTMAGIPLPRPPSFNEEDITDKPLWLQNEWPKLTSENIDWLTYKNRTRLESLRAVDDLVGNVVRALKETKQYNNTIILFTSDNGYLLGEHRLPEKLYAYEESIRVPLFIGGPLYFKGKNVNQFVLNNDLAPTLAEIGGATPDIAVDGTSIVPILKNTNIPWRKRFLIEHFQLMDSVLDTVTSYFAVRTNSITHPPEQTYVEYEDGGKEFYDLYEDPFQMTSLHDDNSTLRSLQRQAHSFWLDGLKNCANGTCQVLEFK